MHPRYHHVLFLLTLYFELCSSLDPGGVYIMSPSVVGEGSYLGCGDDNECSILGIDGVQLHDGWTVVNLGNGNWGFRIRGGTWALDVKSDGQSVFANPDIHDPNSWSDSSNGQLWGLFEWTNDNTMFYNLLKNTAWKKTLDVVGNSKPFVNTDSQEGLMGQHWEFRSVQPQFTFISTTTTIVTENLEATRTTTVTVTTCLNKRDEPTPFLEKRGREIFDITSITNWITVTETTTETDSTVVQTSTDTVFSCEPVTIATTAPGETITSIAGTTVFSSAPGADVTETMQTTVILHGSGESSTQASTEGGSTPVTSTPGKTDAGVSVKTVFTAAPTPTGAGAMRSVLTGTIGWILLFWLSMGYYTI